MDTVENRGGTPDPRDAETVRLLQQRRPEGLRLLLESYAPKMIAEKKEAILEMFRDSPDTSRLLPRFLDVVFG